MSKIFHTFMSTGVIPKNSFFKKVMQSREDLTRPPFLFKYSSFNGKKVKKIFKEWQV
jgi:hypothetical protein